MIQRSTIIRVRVTLEERAMFHQRAKSCGLNMSSYIRNLTKGYEPKQLPPADWSRIVKELHAIGNNLNQIAYVANAKGVVNSESYYLNVIELRRKLKEIEQAVYTDGVH